MFNANTPAEKINEVMLQKGYDETEWEVVGINPNVFPFSDGQYKQKVVKVNRKQAELIAENVGYNTVYAIQRGKNFQFLTY